jgi:hypothetical protein
MVGRHKAVLTGRESGTESSFSSGRGRRQSALIQAEINVQLVCEARPEFDEKEREVGPEFDEKEREVCVGPLNARSAADLNI